MSRSSRVQPLSRNSIDEADVIPFARQLSAYCHALFIPTNLLAVPHIDPYYTAYADHLRPLASFSTVPDNLFAFHEPNGDISLRYSDSEEASFDVIGVIVGFHLDPPVGFPKCVLTSYQPFVRPSINLLYRPNFPFFRRWIKITGVDSPSFAEALKAHEILYHLLADKAIGALPPPRFLVGGTLCLRPSACMLTSLEISPNASPVEIPPSYDDTPYEAAIRAGHGKYIFSDENEVLFFNDEVNANG